METHGLPFPENAPEPGACVRIERPEPGLAVVVLDPPHRSLAVLDAPQTSSEHYKATAGNRWSGMEMIV